MMLVATSVRRIIEATTRNDLVLPQYLLSTSQFLLSHVIDSSPASISSVSSFIYLSASSFLLSSIASFSSSGRRIFLCFCFLYLFSCISFLLFAVSSSSSFFSCTSCLLTCNVFLMFVPKSWCLFIDQSWLLGSCTPFYLFQSHRLILYFHNA